MLLQCKFLNFTRLTCGLLVFTLPAECTLVAGQLHILKLIYTRSSLSKEEGYSYANEPSQISNPGDRYRWSVNRITYSSQNSVFPEGREKSVISSALLHPWPLCWVLFIAIVMSVAHVWWEPFTLAKIECFYIKNSCCGLPKMPSSC